MQRLYAVAALAAFISSLCSCASYTQYSAEIVEKRGPRLIGRDEPHVRIPFMVLAPGTYDVVLWYAITDAGAGYDALGRVTGSATVACRGQTVQESTMPRRGKRSDLFTDTNGLILVRFTALSAGKYVLHLNITSVPPGLEIHGALIRVLKLADASSIR
jgi:hypothetical protein